MIPALPLSDEEKQRFPDIDPVSLRPMEEWLRGPGADPMLRWWLLLWGLWVNGVDEVLEAPPRHPVSARNCHDRVVGHEATRSPMAMRQPKTKDLEHASTYRRRPGVKKGLLGSSRVRCRERS